MTLRALMVLASCAICATRSVGAAVLSNEQLVLRYDDRTAALVDARTAKGIRLAGGTGVPVDVLQDGAWQFSQTGKGLRVRRQHVEQSGEIKRLTIDCTAPSWDVRIVCEMPERGAWFRRRARWKYTGSKPALIERVRFSLPNICIDRPQDCVFTHPSHWPPRDIPFGEMRDGRVRRAAMSGTVPAAAVVYNRRHQLGLCATVFTTEERAEVRIREGRNRIDVEHWLRATDEIEPGEIIELGDEYVALTKGDMLDAIRTCGEVYESAGFRLARRPEWTYGASIYSLPPGGSQTSGSRDLGNFASFRKHMLPRLERLGFDIVWFLPTNPGGYAPREYYSVDPRYGTLDDLRALCDDAHRRGMRIFLDLIPHGPKEHCPPGRDIMSKHPEWVTRNRDGSLFYKWGCLACDYAHPGWQDYMAKLAAFYVERCGIDGWRVDVANGHRPNWRPHGSNRSSHSSPHGPLQLLGKSRSAMARLRPDAALLGETSSWLFLTQCDFVYDWSFEQACRALRGMPADEWVPAIKGWLERQQAALPEGTPFGLTRMLENHDQFKSSLYWGPGHERALLSLCALAPGAAFVFSDQDVGFGPHIRQLLLARKRLPEIAKGRAFYVATGSSVPSVLTFTRTLETGFSVIAVNFGRTRQQVRITPPLGECSRSRGDFGARELFTNTDFVPRPLRDWKELTLDISAYATRIVAFRPHDAPLPRLHEPTPLLRSAASESPLRVSHQDEVLVVENAHYRLELQDGLIRRLTARRESEAHVTLMNVLEGERKAWPGPRLDFAKAAKAQAKMQRRGDKTVIQFDGELSRDGRVRIPWLARYTCDSSPEIGVELELRPPRSQRRVCAELGIELQFAKASEWAVSTLAGQLCDEFAVTHPLGDVMRGWKYWHRSGLLWEASQMPLDLARPAVSVRVGKTWLQANLPQCLHGLENAYLRERDSRGQTGLTLCLAWLDQKGATSFDRPLRMQFGLRFANAPARPTGEFDGPGWKLSAEGANYTFANRHYTLTLGKSRGGGIFGLTPAGARESVITASNVYSDKGIYRTAIEPDGREVKTRGVSSEDYETDAWFERDGDALIVRLNSFLRSSFKGWRNVAGPRTQYALTYRLDASPRVHVEARVRPLIQTKGLRAFLAQTLTLPNASAWRVKLAEGEARGEFDPGGGQRGKRLWESINQPQGPGSAIEIQLENGRRVRFGAIDATPDDVQNVFVLDAGGRQSVAFFAFFNGSSVDYAPAWRRVGYTLEVIRP